MQFKVPIVPLGRYYLKYVSGWTIWRHESKFSQLSPGFIIGGVSCLNQDCSVPPSKSPDSFTHDTAPSELLFMYPKKHNVQSATKSFFDGVIDSPVRIGRGLVSGLTHPKKAFEDAKNVIIHPVQSIHSLSTSFEHGNV